MDIKNRIVNITLKSIGAGMCIALGLYAFLHLDAILGSFVFSVGLLSVFTLSFYLYTGLVPYASIKSIPMLIHVVAGNAIGCLIMLLFPQLNSAGLIAASKLSEPLLAVFVEAVMCNILIYIAVEANKQHNTITVILAVATFIICGFEHSIANIALFAAARMFSVDIFVHLLITIAGNAFGGILIRKVHCGLDENSKDRKRLVE